MTKQEWWKLFQSEGHDENQVYLNPNNVSQCPPSFTSITPVKMDEFYTTYGIKIYIVKEMNLISCSKRI